MKIRTKTLLKRVIVGLTVLAVTGTAVVIWIASSRLIWPPWYEHRSPEQGLRSVEGTPFAEEVWQGIGHDPETDLGLDYSDVEFPTAEGMFLRGWLVPAGKEDRGVVTVHGAGGDRRDFLRHVRFLNAAGYPVLLFDSRDHGVSDGAARGVSYGVREHEDVQAAVRYAKEELGWDRVAVLGTSQGGASVILAAAEDERIDAVISVNPFMSFRRLIRDSPVIQKNLPSLLIPAVIAVTAWRTEVDVVPSPIEVAGRISPRPLLLMHGTEDDFIPPDHSRALYESAGEPKELWILEGARHGQIYNAAPEDYERRVVGFVDRWLSPVDAGSHASSFER